MSRKRSPFRNAAEFVAARSLLVAMRFLPARALPGLSRCLGAVLDWALAGRRRVVRDNVMLAYNGSGNAPEPRALSRASFANLCRSFLELAKLPREAEAFLRCLRFRDQTRWAEIQRILKSGPIVFAGSHFGAYEISGIAAGALGVPLTTHWRPFDNPWLAGWITKVRCRFGQRLVSNRGGMRELFSDLKGGRSVAVLVDVNKRGRSVFVNYFGQPAATAETAARLAYRTERPLVPVFAHRTERAMEFEIDVGEPIWPEKHRGQATEVKRLLQEATTQIERRVRCEPEQWLWTHRRWKTRPSGELESSLR